MHFRAQSQTWLPIANFNLHLSSESAGGRALAGGPGSRPRTVEMKESVRTLPSYFERAKHEPKYLVRALKRNVNRPHIKNVILDSFTLQRYTQSNGDARNVHIFPIRAKLIEETILLLYQLGNYERDIKGNYERDIKNIKALDALEVTGSDGDKSQINTEGRNEEKNRNVNHAGEHLKTLIRAVENQLCWVLAGLMRVIWLSDDSDDHVSEEQEPNVVFKDNQQSRQGSSAPSKVRIHEESAALARWLLGSKNDDEKVLAIISKRNSAISKDKQGGIPEIQRPVSPWIQYYMLESLALDGTLRANSASSGGMLSEEDLDEFSCEVWRLAGDFAEVAYKPSAKPNPDSENTKVTRSACSQYTRHATTMSEEQQSRIVEILALCILSRSKKEEVSCNDKGDQQNIDSILQETFSKVLDVPKGTQPKDAEDILNALFRALRACAVPTCVANLLRAVDLRREDQLFDYDSVMAVAQIATLPNDEAHKPHRLKACSSLLSIVLDTRPYPRHDELRSTALWGLSQLRMELPTPTILEELLDGNPQIVRSAARALESIWGVSKAIQRVLDKAVSSTQSEPADRDEWNRYGRALQWMKDQGGVIQTLQDEWSSGRIEFQECAKTILASVGGFQAMSKLQSTDKVVTAFREHTQQEEKAMRGIFDEAVRDAKRGFSIARGMDVAVFVLGIALIVVAAALALSSDGSLAKFVGSGASGGLGVLGILYSTLLAKPRRQVEMSIDHLMHLQTTFLGFLRQLHQVEQVLAP
jgi:hypothetical protein